MVLFLFVVVGGSYVSVPVGFVLLVGSLVLFGFGVGIGCSC